MKHPLPAEAQDLPAKPAIVVRADSADETTRERAAELARRVGLDCVQEIGPGVEMLLAVTAERLELQFPQRGGPGPMYVDFVEGPLGYAQRVNRFGLLFQAVGFRSGRPSILDATAGLGRDAFRLALHGCQVTAVERSPILHALLADGLTRALADAETCDRLGGRLTLVHADARDILREMDPADSMEGPDVIYLDPMFPPKKKSALPKVEMRILRQLVGDDSDASELFALAMGVARKRVVVKRHRHAPPLGPEPTHSHCDQTARYDVYVPATRRLLEQPSASD